MGIWVYCASYILRCSFYNNDKKIYRPYDLHISIQGNAKGKGSEDLHTPPDGNQGFSQILPRPNRQRHHCGVLLTWAIMTTYTLL